jgi:hypothetical protein
MANNMDEARRQRDIPTVRLDNEVEFHFHDIDYDAASMETIQDVFDMGMSSIIGTRKYQQDSIYGKVYQNMRALAVICDGMGGMNGGEIASKTAVDTLVHDFNRDINISNIPDFFKKEAIKLDECVTELEDEYGNPLGGGSTIVSIIANGNELYWLSVGDSRIYIIRNHEIKAVNQDHNFRMQLDAMLAAGKITAEEYKQEEHQAEALISFLGIGGLSLMETNVKPFTLKMNDIVLLCSDGLYKRLSNKEILKIIEDNSYDMQKAAVTLTDIVMQKTERNQDNTSVALLKYGR